MNTVIARSFLSSTSLKLRTLAVAAVALPVIALTGACGTSNNTSSAAVSEISITPSPCGVGKGDNIAAHAQATLPDGSKQDITDLAAWTSSDTNTLTINNTGIVVGVSAGVTKINAAYLGATASLDCTVTP